MAKGNIRCFIAGVVLTLGVCNHEKLFTEVDNLIIKHHIAQDQKMINHFISIDRWDLAQPYITDRDELRSKLK